MKNVNSKLLRKEWPKVRVHPVKGQDYYRVDLRRAGNTGQKARQFSTAKEALDYARDVAKRVEQSGLSTLGVTVDPRIKQWTEQAAVLGSTFEEVVALGLKQVQAEQDKRQSPLVADVIKKWLDDKVNNPLLKLREKTIVTNKSMGSRFTKDFGTMRIKELNRHWVEEYLVKRDVSQRTRKDILNHIKQILNWCVVKEIIPFNPCDKMTVQQSERGMPEYLNVDQSKEVMRRAMKDPSIVNYFALCLFQGIRPEETEHLTWDNIDLTNKHIVIPEDVSKTRRQRQFTMNDTVHTFLTAYKTEKPLIPAGFRKRKAAVTRSFNGNWIKDVLRHTYCTFQYALPEDKGGRSLGNLAYIMGNSPGIIERVYRGSIPESIVSEFWSINPEALKATMAV